MLTASEIFKKYSQFVIDWYVFTETFLSPFGEYCFGNIRIDQNAQIEFG